MPLNIDGAGRSGTLACLSAARGTVAFTRGQVRPDLFVLINTLLWSKLWGVWWVQGLLCERISGPGGLRARGPVSGFKFLTAQKKAGGASQRPPSSRDPHLQNFRGSPRSLPGHDRCLARGIAGLSRNEPAAFRAGPPFSNLSTKQGLSGPSLTRSRRDLFKGPSHTSTRRDLFKASQNLQRTKNEEVLLLTKMDLIEFRS